MDLRKGADAGRPLVATDRDNSTSQVFAGVARTVCQALDLTS
jgi:hypothetical protein